MPAVSLPLILDPREVPAFRSAMCDLQLSARAFYDATAGFGVDADAMGLPVRTALSYVQVVNDLFLNHSAQRADYAAMFEPPIDPRIEVVQAFKYVRNVAQHLPHPVQPLETAVIGGLHGFHTYAVWQEVPPDIHGLLNRSTQKLKPYYDSLLRGNEVTETFLAVAQCFWEICPEAVHRDDQGEWTGFPLTDQPGVRNRLHPEEPSDQRVAHSWLASRRPGGDTRIVCGALDEPAHHAGGQRVTGVARGRALGWSSPHRGTADGRTLQLRNAGVVARPVGRRDRRRLGGLHRAPTSPA